MYDLNELKDKIAVIGVGNTKYGNFPDIDDYGLAAQAFRNAVNDCGGSAPASAATAASESPAASSRGRRSPIAPFSPT